MNRYAGVSLMALAVALSVAPAAAQTAAGAAPEAKMMRSGMKRASEEMRPFSKPTEREEARLAYVKTALKITDAQQSQWNAYADRMRQQAAEREKMMTEWRARMAENKGKHEHHRPTVIERLEFAQKMHGEAIRRLNERLEVEKPLYAALSSEQKQVADVVLEPRGGPANSGRGHGHGKEWGRT